MIENKKLKVFIFSTSGMTRPATLFLTYLILFKKHKDYNNIKKLS